MSISTLALTSAPLATAGFLHAFSLRGATEEDIARAVGVSPAALYQVTQVHGARVVHAGGERDLLRPEEGDALVATTPSVAVGVRVADCVPVLVGDRASGAVAAIHAGWRGIVSGVLRAALAAMPATGGGGSRVAAIGPCIGPCCFEVGADVGAQIAGACADEGVVARHAGEKAYVDLRRAVRAELCAAGMADADVHDVPGCTRCDATRFFSYRRDGANAGRHLAAIAVQSRFNV